MRYRFGQHLAQCGGHAVANGLQVGRDRLVIQ